MKKGVCLAILWTLIALLSLVSGVPSAFASTRQVTVSHTQSVISRTANFGFRPGGWQTHNQYFRGNSYSHIHFTFHGHNQNNTGNQGRNRGYNQNFAINGGNLIINRGRTRYQRTNQYFQGNSFSRNNGYFEGYNQNNTGNQGDNEGSNEDHGGNAGNQIVN